MATAFFDLDKTLICRNSATLWIISELRGGFITIWQTLRGLFYVFLYELGKSDITSVMREAIRTMAGTLEIDLSQRTQKFYAEKIKHLVRPGAFETIEMHRQKGHKIVLLTSSTNYLSAQICKDLQLDDYVCTKFEVDQHGYFTGEPLEPLCFGKGKVALAKQYLSAKNDGSLKEAYFYTDSNSDLPMLEIVGHAVAVNPDPKLKKMAKEQGWEIVDWGKPQKSPNLLQTNNN